MRLPQQVIEGGLGTGDGGGAGSPVRALFRDRGRGIEGLANQARRNRVGQVVPAAFGRIKAVAKAGSHRRALTVGDARGGLQGHEDRVLDGDLSPRDPERLFERNLQMLKHHPFDRTGRNHHVGLANGARRHPGSVPQHNTQTLSFQQVGAGPRLLWGNRAGTLLWELREVPQPPTHRERLMTHRTTESNRKTTKSKRTSTEPDRTTAERPWYRDGLAFECTRCGACCTGAPGYVWVSTDEIETLAQFRGESTEQFSRRFVRRVGESFQPDRTARRRLYLLGR